MRTIAIMGYGKRLSVSRGFFIVGDSNGGNTRISPADVDEIIIATPGASLSVKAIRLAASMGIPIYIMDNQRDQPLIITPVYSTKTSDTRRHQYKSLDTGKALELARCLVTGRIKVQQRVLERLNHHVQNPLVNKAIEYLKNRAPVIQSLNTNHRKDWRTSLRVLEAEAARAYWGALSQLVPGEYRFKGRDPDSRDPLNSSLNYAYALIYARAYTKLLLAGLDPYAGIYHVDRSGRKSLVYDFTEPFKPHADYQLVMLARTRASLEVDDKGLLTDEAKKNILTAMQRLFQSRVILGDRSLDYEDAMRLAAFRLAHMFRDSIECRALTPLPP